MAVNPVHDLGAELAGARSCGPGGMFGTWPVQTADGGSTNPAGVRGANCSSVPILDAQSGSFGNSRSCGQNPRPAPALILADGQLLC